MSANIRYDVENWQGGYPSLAEAMPAYVETIYRNPDRPTRLTAIANAKESNTTIEFCKVLSEYFPCKFGPGQIASDGSVSALIHNHVTKFFGAQP